MQVLVIIKKGGIKDKYRCECKELIDKERCDKGFIWNPRNYEYECDKSCDVWEYVGYKNCKCRNKLVDKLFKKCCENIDGNEMIYNKTLNFIKMYAILVRYILHYLPLLFK